MTGPGPAPIPEPTPGQVEAYDAGAAAYTAGQDSRAVLDVYPAGSENRLLWVRGFVLARRNDLYGPPEED